MCVCKGTGSPIPGQIAFTPFSFLLGFPSEACEEELPKQWWSGGAPITPKHTKTWRQVGGKSFSGLSTDCFPGGGGQSSAPQMVAGHKRTGNPPAGTAPSHAIWDLLF